MNSTYFPHFTIGSDAYDKIPDICGEYGKPLSSSAAPRPESPLNR